jgi:Na+-translocating ferredoxin:NAD+ oxidoreductase subunit G
MLDNLEKIKDKVSYQTGLLAMTCGIAAMLLVSTEVLTRPVIAQRIAEDQDALLTEVLDGESYANKVFEDGHTVTFQGSSFEIFDVKNSDGELTNHVIRGAEDGYSGTITYLIGVSMGGEIKGVRIISHSETPGLGDKIELAKSSWVLSFAHHSVANTPLWGVKKDGGTFDQFSGATITPRSVVKGVHKAMLALQQDQESRHE